MVEEIWDQQPSGILGYTHLDTTPPWVSGKAVTGQLHEPPVSIHTAVSELQFVADGEDTPNSPTDSESCPSPCSQISQMHFASPEETMTPLTPTEIGPQSPDASPTFSTPEEPTQMVPSNQPTLTTYKTSVSPDQPGWSMHRLGGSGVPDSDRVGRRPLPDVPGQAQSRPLPPRPAKIATAAGRRGASRFSYPPFQEFVRGYSRGSLASSRPVSDSGPDRRSQSAEKQPIHDLTPEDSPPVYHRPAPHAITSPASVSPSPFPSPPPSLISHPSFVMPSTPGPRYPAALVLPSQDPASPTSIDLVTAAGLAITGENGEQILFGALFRDRKVIVIFIRYFWCLFCENYLRSISNSVTPKILGDKGVDLVVIANGGHEMIKLYKSTPLFTSRDPYIRRS